MLSITERLHALHAQTRGEHIRFEKRKNRKDALSKALSTTMAILALAAGATAAAGAPATVTAVLAVLLLAATGMKLAVTDTAGDRDLYLLADAWRRHQHDAGLLLTRTDVEGADDTADDIHRDTVDLERQIGETRTRSLLFGPEPLPGPATPPPTDRNS